MKYFKDEKNNVFAFEEDGSQDDFIRNDLTAITEQEANELRFPSPTPEQVMQSFTAEIQRRLDNFARTRNYDGVMSACTYTTSLIPKFKAEGQYAVEARDNTWAAAYALLAEVEAGTRPMPTLEEVLAELPVLVWPQ